MENRTRRDILKAAAATTVVAGTGGILAACGGSSSSSGSAAGAVTGTSTESQGVGGTLRIALSEFTPSETLDPNRAVGKTDNARAANIFNPLVAQDPNGRPKLILAEELTPNKDATEWTLRLKKGITFHDGKPLTVDDVIYTLKRILNPKEPLAAEPAFKSIDANALKKVDALTLTIPCKTPFATMIQAMAIASFSTIVPVGFDPKNPIGTGPFKYGSFVPGKETVMLKNDNYWEENRPFVDKVVMIAFNEPVARINALLAGQIDLTDSLSGDAVPQLKSAGKQVVISEGGGYNSLSMRCDREPFNDVRVRQAMRLLVDREQVRDLVSSGYGHIGNDVFGLLAPEYDKALPQRKQDVEQAQSLLKSAGQSDMRVTLTSIDVSEAAVKLCQVFAQQASDAGVDVKVKTMPLDQFYAGYPTALPFYPNNWYNDYYLPNCSFATISGATWPETGFENPKYDRLFNEAVATVDESKRAEIAHEMQRIDYEEGGYILPVFTPYMDAAGENVKGLEPTKTGLPLNGLNFVDISVT